MFNESLMGGCFRWFGEIIGGRSRLVVAFVGNFFGEELDEETSQGRGLEKWKEVFVCRRRVLFLIGTVCIRYNSLLVYYFKIITKISFLKYLFIHFVIREVFHNISVLMLKNRLTRIIKYFYAFLRLHLFIPFFKSNRN